MVSIQALSPLLHRRGPHQERSNAIGASRPSHRPRNCAPSGRCCFRPQRLFDAEPGSGLARRRHQCSLPAKTIPCFFFSRRPHSRGVPSAAPHSRQDLSALEYPKCLSPCLDSRLHQLPAPETWRVPDEVVICALAMLNFFAQGSAGFAGTCLGRRRVMSRCGCCFEGSIHLLF